jgi:hypothetical protein
MRSYTYDPQVPATRSCPMCGRVMRLVVEWQAESEQRPDRRISRTYVCSNTCCEHEQAA